MMSRVVIIDVNDQKLQNKSAVRLKMCENSLNS